MKRILRLERRAKLNNLIFFNKRNFSSKNPKNLKEILKDEQEEEKKIDSEKLLDENNLAKNKFNSGNSAEKGESGSELQDGNPEENDNINDQSKGTSQEVDSQEAQRKVPKKTRKTGRILPKLSIKNAQKTEIPDKLPNVFAIPLQRRPLFPGFYKSLHIKDPYVIKVIQDLMKNGVPFIGIFLSKNENEDKDIVTNIDEIEKVGVLAQITNTYQTGPDNALTVVVYPHKRIRITDLKLPDAEKSSSTITVENGDADGDEFGRDIKMFDLLKSHVAPIAQIENLKDQPYSTENRVVRATTAEIITVFKELSQSNPLLRDQIITVNIQSNNVLMDPAKLADFAAALSSGEPSELQGILESLVVEERLHKALVVLKNELANAKLQQEISQEVDRKIGRKNQEYFLMEQLRGIKKELGMETDGKEKLLEQFKAKAAQLSMPDHVKQVFDEVI
jgi:Lon-like ATP-dependent protease